MFSLYYRWLKSTAVLGIFVMDTQNLVDCFNSDRFIDPMRYKYSKAYDDYEFKLDKHEDYLMFIYRFRSHETTDIVSGGICDIRLDLEGASDYRFIKIHKFNSSTVKASVVPETAGYWNKYYYCTESDFGYI